MLLPSPDISTFTSRRTSYMQYNYSATILSCTIYSNGFTFDWILSIAPRANRYHRMIPVRATVRVPGSFVYFVRFGDSGVQVPRCHPKPTTCSWSIVWLPAAWIARRGTCRLWVEVGILLGAEIGRNMFHSALSYSAVRVTDTTVQYHASKRDGWY